MTSSLACVDKRTMSVALCWGLGAHLAVIQRPAEVRAPSTEDSAPGTRQY